MHFSVNSKTYDSTDEVTFFTRICATNPLYQVDYTLFVHTIWVPC